jgi:hypothetical protein
LSGLLLLGCVNLCLHLFELDFHLGHLRLEIDFIDEAISIAVNESRFPLLQMMPVFFERCCIGIDVMILFQPVQTLLIFFPQPLRILQ